VRSRSVNPTIASNAAAMAKREIDNH